MMKNIASDPLAREMRNNEKGQSIVIIAFVMIGLLAFVGIAVDVGFVFARTSQLQAAVDAAVLAGVTELSGPGIVGADDKAAQFLRANGIPISVTQTFVSSEDVTILGAREYSITATWPVELFFLRVIGQEEVSLSRSATAAYFPLADIYASRRIEDGIVSTANQSVFGPHICTRFGDPFSPLNSMVGQPGFYTYNYRIMIPDDYPSNVLRVELFDPDSINDQTNVSQVNYTNVAINYDPIEYPPTGEPKTCPNTDTNDACLIPTGEMDIADAEDDVTVDHINPFWFKRVDENRGSGGGNGDGTCSEPANYVPRYNTRTVYELFYYAQSSDGSISRADLASYTGQTGDGSRDIGDHLTDLRWVSPGGDQLYDQPVPVPTDGCNPLDPDCDSFEIDLTTDVPDIIEDPSSGVRYIYLDVSTVSGASENGFEVWAGPKYTNFSSDVNVRNIQILNNPGTHSSEGVAVFAMGRLPMNSNFDNPVDIPLLFVGPDYVGQSIFISLFDPDAGTTPPITFFYDSIAFEPFDGDDYDGIYNNEGPGDSRDETDWGKSFGGDADPNTEGRCFTIGDSCNDQWSNPPYEIVTPGDLDNCDWQNQENDVDDCTPFYGGRLTTRYESSQGDTYVWQITLEGLPYLVR